MHISPSLNPDTLTTAHLVVTNPDSFHDDLQSRLNAWTALKAARGQRVNKLRLQLLQNAYQLPEFRPHLRAPAPEAPVFDGLAS